MMEKDQDELTSKQNKLQAVLTEYSALRTELLQKFEHHIRLFYITIIVFMSLEGYILTQKAYDVLMWIPIFIIPLACRYIWEQSVIGVISRYIEKEIEQRKISELIGCRSNTSKDYEKYWVGWQHYWVEKTPKSFYKPAIIFLFVIIPFAPSLLWSIVCITSVSLDPNVQSCIPINFHILISVIYVFLAFYIGKKLLRA